IWGIARGTLHTRLVGGTVAMFERMMAGDIKACWIICTNPVATVSNRKNVIAGLQKAELVITQDASGHRNEPLCRHFTSRSALGRGGRRDDQFRT
ncbi:hypothetical protein, partial [Raoultella sp. Ech2A]|uniref:hypothetical protein n=1 Tax=Raoultella sp. Ech2A TaxID=2996539 RepID=UPI0032E03230